MHALFELLREKIDVPARQIVIEALVIELLSDRARDLGVSFTTTQNQYGFEFAQTDALTGNVLPFIFTFDKDRQNIATFRARLSALFETGEAELLSNPSVLVLDGRQARIQIAQQVPVITTTSTVAATTSSVEYFPVGIVLNLRPRIVADGTEITMQTETIVSAVNQLATSQVAGVAQVFVAPVVDNRQVQTFVRIADNTPYHYRGTHLHRGPETYHRHPAAFPDSGTGRALSSHRDQSGKTGSDHRGHPSRGSFGREAFQLCAS